jgi:hypothetical protein
MQSRVVLVGGDVVAFVAFGLLGLASHEDGITATTIARSILPFVVSWLAIAPWSGAFGERAVDGRFSVANVLIVWFVAGIAGMCLRAVVFDRALFTAFFAIGITGMGLFLGGWRAIYNWWATRPTTGSTEVRTLGR